jgi:hypothetical protein
MDLSTSSTTGTFKDWVACYTIAYCLDQGIDRFVGHSSGNTLNALARYASRSGVTCALLYPAGCRYKICPTLASLDGVCLVEIDAPEPEIRQWAGRLAHVLQMPVLPTPLHQIEANRVRAFLLEDLAKAGHPPGQWHSQVLSSAFGIFGLYDGLRLFEEPAADRPPIPRLLGIQQEALSPYVAYLHGGPSSSPVPVLEPTLFRSAPERELLERMRSICQATNGHVVRLQNRTYHELEPDVLHILDDVGLAPVRRPDASGRFVEYSGLMALAGTLQEIRGGRIGSRDSVLVALTGGFGGDRTGTYSPRFRVASSDGFDAVHEILTSQWV